MTTDQMPRVANRHKATRPVSMVLACTLSAAMIASVSVQAAEPSQTPVNDEAAAGSTVQGQTHLSGSFDQPSAPAEAAKNALEATTYKVQLRTYYLDRDQFDDSQSEAWAAGGWLGAKTGYFGGRVSFGGTVYGSYPVDAPDDKDGTGLLAPGQESYTVLGELYADIKLSDAANAFLGRKEYDTPYINRSDLRMTPNTFEAYTFVGGNGGDGGAPEWRYGAGYFDKIKQRTSEDFIPMSEAIGVDEDRGVYTAGLHYRKGGFSIGAIDYFSDDIINIAYAEAGYEMPLSDKLRLRLAGQYSDQRSVGDDLLMGDFSSHQFGLKGEIVAGPALFTVAYTSVDDGADMQSPWGSYPGYTFAQVESFSRAGEDSFMLRAAYDFESVPGLSAYALYINGSDPVGPANYARDEYDLNLQWKATTGRLKGLAVRLRYANVSQDDPGNSSLDDFRIIVNYALPGL